MTRTASPAATASFRPTGEPELSIVIVTFGTGHVLERCLAALAATLDGLDAEVILVDNRHPVRNHWSADRVSLTTSGVRVLRPTGNLGFGGGNAAGVASARADLICLLNPDVMFEPGQLALLVDRARAHPDRIVAPGFRNLDGSVQELGSRLLSNAEVAPILEGDSRPPDFASAACWLFQRSVYERLGGFDPVYHPAYYEDVDFALRAAGAGVHTEIVADVLVTHVKGSSVVEPDVWRQRAVFRRRWAELLSDRPHR